MRFALGSRGALSALLVTLACWLPGRAWAGGFDTPILYTARHLGMGGTAIGSVDDPSAAFHNPAGLSGVHGFAFVADGSLLLGKLQASPDPGASVKNVDSELTVAPFFLAGAAYRLHPWVSLGVALFPVASGGARYKYSNIAGSAIDDETRLLFLELSPVVSVNVPKDLLLPGELSIGVGYRLDILDFKRSKGPPGNPAVLDLEMSGMASGVRAGVQWKPNPSLGFGIVFRNKVTVDGEGDNGRALGQQATDYRLRFVLPSKLGGGARCDVGRFGIAADVEYGFYSQNQVQPLRGDLDGRPGEVANAFRWSDAITTRFGLEHRFGAAQEWPVRVGYLFDGKVASERFPNAFGTPPGPTHTLTAGAGAVFKPFRVDVAYAYRFGSAEVRSDQVAPAAECRFCGFPGDYKIAMHGIYVAVGADFPVR